MKSYLPYRRFSTAHLKWRLQQNIQITQTTSTKTDTSTLSPVSCWLLCGKQTFTFLNIPWIHLWSAGGACKMKIKDIKTHLSILHALLVFLNRLHLKQWFEWYIIYCFLIPRWSQQSEVAATVWQRLQAQRLHQCQLCRRMYFITKCMCVCLFYML